jgi:hypothetical protein
MWVKVTIELAAFARRALVLTDCIFVSKSGAPRRLGIGIYISFHFTSNFNLDHRRHPRGHALA